MTERAIPLSVFGQVTSNIEWREQIDLKEAIYSRRAVPNFTAESIDKKTLRQLIDAAIQTLSVVNQQPWSFSVVRDNALLSRISREALRDKDNSLGPGIPSIMAWSVAHRPI
jgi:nitroreductase